MEPDDGDKYYSESLVRLPNLASSYPYPQTGHASTPSSISGKSGGKTIYANIQSLYKLLPQHDNLYPRIAREVPNCQFWFIGGKSKAITSQFYKATEKYFQTTPAGCG